MKRLTEQQINILKSVVKYDLVNGSCCLTFRDCCICPFSKNNNKFYFKVSCTSEDNYKIQKICKDYLNQPVQLEFFK